MTKAIWPFLNDLEFSLKFINVNGIKTRCLEAGTGEPLIFLHGTGGHIEAYSRNIRAHAKYFRVLVIDMIGHGYSDKPDDQPYTIPYYVEHLKNFMDVMKLEQAFISGESLGGWVAGAFTIQYPERVKKLVLNTSGGLSAYPEVMNRVKTLNLKAVNNPTEEVVRERLAHLMYDPNDVTDELVTVRRTIYSQPNMPNVMKLIVCLQDMETRTKYMFTEEQLQTIKCPACIIWTSHDPTAPKEIGLKFQRNIAGSEFHLMENCGHWPQFEDPETFNNIHIRFLLK